MAGVARAAASRALERAVTDFAGHVATKSVLTRMEEGNSISDCLVTRDDFEKAVEDVFECSKGGDYTETGMSTTSHESNKNEESDSADPPPII